MIYDSIRIKRMETKSSTPSQVWEDKVIPSIEQFENACQLKGGDCISLGAMALNCFRQFQWILMQTESHKCPQREKLLEMAKPMTMVVEYASGHRDKKSRAYNHQSAFAFYIPICLWFLQLKETPPVEFIELCKLDGEKYLNKIRAKSKGEADELFISSLTAVADSLLEFVLELFPSGLVWNELGEDLGDAVEVSDESKDAKKPLKTGVVSYYRAKWDVLGFENHPLVVLPVDKLNRKQSVCISQCKNSTVTISSKVKVVLMDSCSGCILETGDVVSSIELVNCRDINLHVEGSVPTVSIEKCNNVQLWLFLPKEEETDYTFPEVVTSNSEQVNLQLPNPSNAKRDHIETPIPHQFVTTITPSDNPQQASNYSLVTVPVKHC